MLLVCCYNIYMSTITTERYFLFILLLIALIVTFVFIYPFLAVFILAAAFSVILNPIYLLIKKYIVRNISWLASTLTLIFFLLVLCVPLFFIGKSIFIQSQNLYTNLVSSGNSNTIIESIDSSINKLLPSGFNFDLSSKVKELTNSFTNNLAELFSSTLNSLFMFSLMILALFYLLKDGDKWKSEIINILPLSNNDTQEILNNLHGSIKRIFGGSFIIAIAQGTLAWFGFMLFGVPNAIIWAAVAGICSFIPTVGTSLVSVPAMLFLYFSGMEWQAVGLLLWSVLLVSTIDNILYPYIVSGKTEIPSLFILFSILGGVSLIGPLGILIGPLVISFLYSLITIYKKESLN
jgi:predicted PurR-regulated permease PerM